MNKNTPWLRFTRQKLPQDYISHSDSNTTNYTPHMKLSVLLLPVIVVALSSCETLDPEYAAYKKQKQVEKAGQGPLTGGDPYAVNANPYGAPGQGGSDVGTYTPQRPAPYQPLPGAPTGNDPYAPTAPRTGFPTIPNPPAGGPVTTHIVVAGDSLWAGRQKYGTSADAIRQANGLTGDTIRAGATLQIPGN
jgi:LysM repeat protein